MDRASEQVQSQLLQLRLALDSKRSDVVANVEIFSAAPLLREFINGSEFERTNIYQRPLSRLFLTYQNAYPDYTDMAVLSASGETLAGVFSFMPSREILERFPAQVDDTRSVYVGQPLVAKPSLLVVRKLESADDGQVGYLAILFDLGFLQSLLEVASSASGISFNVTDPAGQALFSSSRHASLLPSGIPGQTDAVPLVIAGESFRVTSRPVLGELHLIAMVSERALAAGADMLTSRVLGLIAIVTVVTIVLVYVGMRMLVIGRLRALDEAAQRIGSGDLTAPVAVKGSDEIAGLGKSFDIMRERLLEGQRRLNDYNKTLEQKVAERTRELVDTQQQLVLKEKLASTSVLTAGVAHEINNPINYIYASAQNMESMLETFQGFVTELLAEESEPDISAAFAQRFDSLRSQLYLVLDGSLRIRDIVHNLRVITHLDQRELRPVDIIDGLEKTIAMIEIGEGSDIVFERSLAVRPRIMGYGAELNQMFMIILANACQAIDDRKDREPTAPKGLVRITAATDAEQLCIVISDNGCGMKEEVLARALDPFFTTREVGAGTGLGLSIARAIINKHDGDLAMTSQPGVGTAVELRMPVLEW